MFASFSSLSYNMDKILQTEGENTVSVTFVCDLCSDHIIGGEAFYGRRDGESVVSCFDCYLSELKSFTVGGETIRYNAGERDLDPQDWVVFYDRDGRVLSKLPMTRIDGGQLKPAKEAVAEESGMSSEYITIVIEAHEHDVKGPAL